MDKDPIELLIVEDNEDDLFNFKRALRKEEPNRFAISIAGTMAEALEQTRKKDFDVAVLDLSLPDSRGLNSFRRLYEAAPDLPVVVLTGNEDEDQALNALGKGAQDYMVKGQVDGHSVVRSIRYAIERHHRRQLEQSNAALTEEVTERKRMQKELELLTTKLQRSNRELQQFASVASHDLQEPLRKIIVFGGRLEEKAGSELGEQAHNYLERMTKAAERMQSLIHDLLAFSRVTSRSEPFQAVDFGEITREVINDLEVLIERVGGIVDVGTLPTIEADPFQVRQLMQNLIANALKFHRKDVPSQVRIRSQAIESNGAGDVPAYRISLEDNGIGFEEKYIDRIFLPFQRLDGSGEYEGLGMGLAICHRIIERHGGSIEVRSTPGVGTTFLMTLPAAQPNDNLRSA